MKTCSDTPNYKIIDTAPMKAAYVQLCALAIVLIEQKAYRAVEANTRAILKTVREFIKADVSNHRVDLKLRMLSQYKWRERVLRDLGGARKLALWDAALKRAMKRAQQRLKNGPPPKPPYSAWRKTDECMAKEEWAKVHAQKCAKACAPANITRDPFRMDQAGEFRLAPVPRGPRLKIDPACRVFFSEEYEYNAVPFAPHTGYDAPVTVWPQEFRAAEALDSAFQDKLAEVKALRGLMEGKTSNSVIPHKTRSVADAGSIVEDRSLSLDPPSHCISQNEIQKVRDDKIEKGDALYDTEEDVCAFLPDTGEGRDALPEHPT